mgnify:FL=1
MKRCSVLFLVIALMLSGLALAEREVFADQGGVAVYAEDGRVGLVDSDDNVIYEAREGYIAPFEGDYALAYEPHETILLGFYKKYDIVNYGIINRKGEELLPRQYDYIELYGDRAIVSVGESENDPYLFTHALYDLKTGEMLLPEQNGDIQLYGDWAVFSGYGDHPSVLYDLNTGEVLLKTRPYEDIDVYDRLVTVETCTGEVICDEHHDYFTQVYDLELNYLTSFDGHITGGFENGWARIWFNDGMQGVLTDRGELLLDDDRQDRICFDYIDEGVVTYKSSESRERTVREKLLMRFGLIKRGKRYESSCGILFKDGRQLDIDGFSISGPDSEGLFCVGVEKPAGLLNSEVEQLYGYIDAQGSWAIPPIYEYAGAFIDGAAIVKMDSQYALINPQGQRVTPPDTYNGWKRYGNYTFFRNQDDKYTLFDARGQVLFDEIIDCDLSPHNIIYMRDAENGLWLIDLENDRILDCRAWSDFRSCENGDPSVIWLKEADGLYGCYDRESLQRVNDYRYAATNTYFYSAQLPEDGGHVYIDGRGTPLGPAPY